MNSELIGKIFDLGSIISKLLRIRKGWEDEREMPLFLAFQDVGNEQIQMLPVTIASDAGSCDVVIPASGVQSQDGTNVAVRHTVHCAHHMLCPADVLREMIRSLQINAFHMRRIRQRENDVHDGRQTPNRMDAEVDADDQYRDQDNFLKVVVEALETYFDNLHKD